jgi:hypothetical protein
VFEHDIGIRFNGKERFDVEEYYMNMSAGWIKVPAGKTLDRKGRPLSALDRHPGHKKLPAGHMVDGAQLIGRVFKVPAPVTEHARIRPGPDHLADEQVVSLLVVRLRHQPADQPADAAFHQRQIAAGRGEYLHPVSGELVGHIAGALSVPTPRVRVAMARVGNCRAKKPLASISSRVKVALSSTTVTLGACP